MKTLLLSSVLILLLTVPPELRAQNHSLDWHTINGGGGTSSGVRFAASGTIGQAQTGFMRAGNVAIQGGFWAFAAEPPANITTCTWTNLASGEWNSPANWSPN